MPDGLNAYTAGGQTYLVTANEGDAREWGDYVEVVAREGPRRRRLRSGVRRQPARRALGDAELGRLNVTQRARLRRGRRLLRRAVRVRRTLVLDLDDRRRPRSSTRATRSSRSPHAANAAFFNSNHTESNLEGRSDDKGPEPENLTIGEIDGRTYAFIGFERVGGIAVFDITEPAASRFVTYVNNRDFSVSVEDADDPAAVLSQAGDLGPEGLAFIPRRLVADRRAAPGGRNEVSGTTTLFSIAGALTRRSRTRRAAPPGSPAGPPHPGRAIGPDASSDRDSFEPSALRERRAQHLDAAVDRRQRASPIRASRRGQRRPVDVGPSRSRAGRR